MNKDFSRASDSRCSIVMFRPTPIAFESAGSRGFEEFAFWHIFIDRRPKEEKRASEIVYINSTQPQRS